MAARPPVLAATAPAPDSFRIVRRVMRAMFPPVYSCATESRVLGRAPARTEASNRGFMAVGVQPSAPGCDASREYAGSAQTASLIRAGDGGLRRGCLQRWRHAAAHRRRKFPPELLKWTTESLRAQIFEWISRGRFQKVGHPMQTVDEAPKRGRSCSYAIAEHAGAKIPASMIRMPQCPGSLQHAQLRFPPDFHPV